MLVKDCIAPDPPRTHPDAPVAEALELMRATRTRDLPVVERGRLVGMVSRMDLMDIPAGFGKGRSPRGSARRITRVKDMMREGPPSVSPDTPVESAARTLRESGGGALPVIDRRRLVGLVTETDLIGAAVHLLGGDIRGVGMSVTLPRGLHDLARLVDVLARQKLDVAAMSVTARLDETGRSGYVRIATVSPLAVADALAAAGLEVSSLRLEPLPKPARAIPLTQS